MMEFLSDTITGLTNGFLIPFGQNHAAGLVWLSLLTGVGMAFVFKAVSNQEAIKRSRDMFKAYILETRIYQDHLGHIFAAFWGTVRSNAVYLRYALFPIVVLIIPVVIVFMQLDERYGRRPLSPGSTTLVTVTLVEGANPFTVDPRLEITGDAAVDAGPLRIADPPEVNWRLRFGSPDLYVAKIRIDGTNYDFPITVDVPYKLIGHKRSASSFIEPFLHPGMPRIPSGSLIRSVRVHYPSTSWWLFIWHTHWIVVFLVFTLIGALAVKYIFGLEI